MAYCTRAQLQGLMDQTFAATSSPTATEVEQMIDDVASEIDGVLRAAGYSTPVTATNALPLLRRMNQFGAAPSAFHGSALTDTEPARVKYWREAYDAFLVRIRKGEQYLPDLDPEEADDEFAFGIAPGIQREEYWLTDQEIS